MIIRVDGIPIPQGSMRVFNNRIVHYNDQKLKEWRNTIARAFVGEPRYEGPVSVMCVFYLPRPKTVTRQQPDVKPDIDKLARAVLDALTGISYKDDCQVTDLKVHKRYGPAGVDILVCQA